MVSQKLASMASRAAGSAASVTAISVAATSTTPRTRLTATIEPSGGGGHSINPSVTPVSDMANTRIQRAERIGWRARASCSSRAAALRV